TQELNSDVAKVLQASPLTEGAGPNSAPPPPPPPSQSNESSSFNAAGTQTPPAQPPTTTTKVAPALPQAAYPNQPEAAPNYGSQPSSPPYGPQFAPQPAQQQPYPGFGTGNTGGTNTAPSGSSVGGFNIKY